MNDGSGSDNLSPGVTSTINIAATNDPTTVPGGNAFPSLSGVPKAGVALNGTIAALSDPDGLTNNGNPSYGWQSSVDGTSWNNITPPATSSSFTPTANEAGKYLRVVVTVIDNQSFPTFFGASAQPTESATARPRPSTSRAPSRRSISTYRAAPAAGTSPPAPALITSSPGPAATSSRPARRGFRQPMAAMTR